MLPLGLDLFVASFSSVRNCQDRNGVIIDAVSGDIAAIDLPPGNWSEFGEKFSVRFGWNRLMEFLDEEVQI